ncbi:hypothetical protein N7468_010781 [Penicillium chermesinum]|uniref:Xylanolytic transcriptional activator regulatory domain-containing protein n=1 Tax=Penicillium chermesinum TaxID=63820 RepID=A0A9W9TA16_9EURO|nr:uncharacterized protein N7468_010781 [Penicillium chermesinum]KAJ5215102.1 hypothetical protein N7468_010781 [Penicillium chermesinum]KAJ6141408.1 hypothetical protein N7470_009798 [Penicillium chermesinum]
MRFAEDTRCQKLEKQCVFFEIPRDPVSARLESVESEIQSLRHQLAEVRQLLQQGSIAEAPPSQELEPTIRHREYDHQEISAPVHPMYDSHRGSLGPMTIPETAAPLGDSAYSSRVPAISPMQGRIASSYGSSDQLTSRPPKRRRSAFEVREEAVEDFIDTGLITLEDALSHFNTFFQGCDRFIPIFDPHFDTFNSVRSRSSMLLNAICTTGCMVETRASEPKSEMLHAELKKWINVIIQNKRFNCLESVQAMLVIACYSAERLLILSFATRMAVDLGLHEAFEELTEKIAIRNDQDVYGTSGVDDERERVLMRQSRTWFGLLVLEHIFRVDAGKPPGIHLVGNPRRCRSLLGHSSTTVLDLRLLSQVELNILRAAINDTLGSGRSLDHESISDFVHDMKVDLDLWFDDWLRIIEGSTVARPEKPYLLAAMRIQKCWAEMMLNCKALRAMDVQNVAAMSSAERTILLTAKSSARRHLRLMIVEPEYYLASLKYAMDFVWAKCAFSFLLLLKLSRLLPERAEEHQQLLEQGNRLVDELGKTGPGSNQSGAGNIYLQILKVSIEKYGRALQEAQQASTGGSTGTSPFWELFDAQADLQWFVPEQFVSEWDFPGLNLFYFPTAWQDSFGDFSRAM